MFGTQNSAHLLDWKATPRLSHLSNRTGLNRTAKRREHRTVSEVPCPSVPTNGRKGGKCGPNAARCGSPVTAVATDLCELEAMARRQSRGAWISTAREPNGSCKRSRNNPPTAPGVCAAASLPSASYEGRCARGRHLGTHAAVVATLDWRTPSSSQRFWAGSLLTGALSPVPTNHEPVGDSYIRPRHEHVDSPHWSRPTLKHT